MTKISPPDISELSVYYASYLKYVTEEDLLEALSNQTQFGQSFLYKLTEEQANHSYQPGKWKLKEVIGHLSDTERILAYRALCFSRGDQGPLPAFDEDLYVLNSAFKNRNLNDILQEWNTVRQASFSFFRSLSITDLAKKGNANNQVYSVGTLLFFILAHERHHLQVIKDRYLK